MKDNFLRLQMSAVGENVALSRLLLTGLLRESDIPCDILDELKIALSEAVSNAVIHGYGENPAKQITLTLSITDDMLEMTISDQGVGIRDVKSAMELGYSGHAEHLGLGFTFMGSFSDTLSVQSTVGHGTTVTMRRDLHPARISRADAV